MLHNGVELHNVAEVREIPGLSGVRLQRVPERVRVCLEAAQQAMLSPACCEIRFVTDDEVTTEVVLSCPEGEAQAVVFYGPFQVGDPYSYTIRAEPQTISLTMPDRLRLLDRPRYCGDLAFSPNARRLVLAGSPVHLHSVEGTGVRPPLPDELPKLRYLAYGTSITHGYRATLPHLCYASQAARGLGADLLNLGVGGSAFCEPELADYIAGRDDWDFATLALSVNMLANGFTTDGFYERTSYMINAVAGANTVRPVGCVTLFPFFGDWGEHDMLASATSTGDAYRAALREAVKACPYPNAHLLEGEDVLTDWSGLTSDLCHPGDNGMIQMGAHLARLMQPLVADL
jgi:hypothetical protein